MHADNDPSPPQEAPASAAEEPISDAPAAETAAALDPWEELEADVAKWKELSLRTAAEMENLRILAAVPRFPHELNSDVFPPEAGLQCCSAVSAASISSGNSRAR